MRKKHCPKCNLISFSACREVWICPYCNEDISGLPDYDINEDTEIIKIKTGESTDKIGSCSQVFKFNPTRRINN